MGKQRTPQGQRAGHRMPLRRGPVPAPAAEMPSEPMLAAEPQPNQAAATEDLAPAEVEVLDAAPVAARSSSEVVTEAVSEPESDETVEALDASAAEVDGVTEPQAGAIAAEPKEPAAVDEPTGETAAQVVSEEGVWQDPAEVAASDVARAEAPDPDSIGAESLLPVSAFAALDAADASEAGAARPAVARTTVRFTFAPVRIDVEGIGVVLANYMHNESVAILSYMRALGAARSPADMIRLNVTAMQRAADASLTCWSDIARRTAQGVPWQREKAAA